jgi:hypothetical protein
MISPNLKDLFKLNLNFSVECFSSSIAFRNAIQIYINKPQVVNKWVAGSISLTSDKMFKDTRIDNYQIDYKQFIPKSNKIFSSLNYQIVYESRKFIIQI